MQLSFWINAFIPRTVSGYTQEISKGKHSGMTAVPLPGLARLHPGNLFKAAGAGYLTDQRSFSDQRDSSVRMRSYASVMLRGNEASLINSGHETSGTTEVNIDSGEELGFAPADLSRCTWTALTPALDPGLSFGLRIPSAGQSANAGRRRCYAMSLKGAASDPLVSASADIDYVGEFTIVIEEAQPPMAAPRVELWFNGKIDKFPAFEAYATFGSQTATLFTSPPPEGNTVVDLLGKASRPVNGLAAFPGLVS